MAISMQDAILNSANNLRHKSRNNNIQDVLQELFEVGNCFDSLLEKHRKLIKIEKALLELNSMNQFSNEEKELIKTEMLRLKIHLENNTSFIFMFSQENQ